MHTKPVLHIGHLAPFLGFLGASARTPPLAFRSQAMQPPPPSQGLRQKAAIGAAENDGGNNASADNR
jgi:hypothetical protein